MTSGSDHIGDHRASPIRPWWWSRQFPTADFYQKFLRNIVHSSNMARRGIYDEREWARTSGKVLQSLESVGVRFNIEGTQHIRDLTSPCVFVGNHMSMLETIVLPSIIQPIRDVTFVVKQSLLDYPVFKHIVRARGPIAVTRENPRKDFKTVMHQGVEKLNGGISIVVFPQTTRSNGFDPSQFNTIGIKLAAKAGVPIVPFALKTDAWGNGHWIKDFGPIDAGKAVHFEFGKPIVVEGRGDQQRREVIEFIESRLRQWSLGSVDRTP